VRKNRTDIKVNFFYLPFSGRGLCFLLTPNNSDELGVQQQSQLNGRRERRGQGKGFFLSFQQALVSRALLKKPSPGNVFFFVLGHPRQAANKSLHNLSLVATTSCYIGHNIF